MGWNLADLFESSVDSHGDREAVVAYGTHLTYHELDARANHFANWLAKAGLHPGAVVGVALHNRIEHLEVLIGSFKAGMIPINVNYRYTASELVTVLEDAGAELVVYEPDLAEEVAEASRDHHWLRLEAGPGFYDELAATPAARPVVDRSEDDRYVLYTGGTTGQPKGVVWRHGDLIDVVLPGKVGDARRVRVLPACPMIHGTAQWSALMTLCNAGTVVLGTPFGFDPESTLSLIEAERVNQLVIVGDAFARPLLSALDAEPDRWDLSWLVVISSGGARWSPSVRDGLLAHLPHTAMVNSFGASETGGQGAEVVFAGQEPPPTGGLLRFASDADNTVLGANNRPVTAGSGVIGRVARRGRVPLGYLDDDRASAETFPVIDGERWAIPGDLATLEADGTIVVLGRDRNVINTGGEKVFAENVEQVLVSHPAVLDAVVCGIADPHWGERVSALVTVRPGEEVSVEMLIEHCREHLARFKVPRSIRISTEIRRHHNGKLDRGWATDTMNRSEI